MSAPPPCPVHEARIRACVDKLPHLTKAQRRRLRADYGRQCTPGMYGCQPLKETR